MKKYSLLASCLLVATAHSVNAQTKGKNSNLEVISKRCVPHDERQVTNLKVSISKAMPIDSEIISKEEFKKNINTHLVKIKDINNLFNGSKIVCQKQGSQKGIERKFQSAEVDMTISLASSDPTQVDFNCVVGDMDDVKAEQCFTLKKSFIISGAKEAREALGVKLFQKLDIGTLYFENGAALITNGMDLNINAEELYSENGRITTFRQSDSFAKPNRPGLSGGTINISANKTLGEINVLLIGQNGGEQTHVPLNVTEVPNSSAERDALSPKCGNDRSERDHHCIGMRGAQGFQGLHGANGLPGGDSGKLTINTNDRNLKIKVIRLPGNGGQGGIGGDPGRGALSGGIGSTVRGGGFPYGRSVKLPDGGPGLPGIQGFGGENGRDGNKSKVEVFYQGAEVPEHEYLQE